MSEIQLQKLGKTRKLIPEDIRKLGFDPGDFETMMFTQDGLVADLGKLTDGNYSDDLVNDVKHFYS